MTATPKAIAKRFMERAEALGLKGKKRDDAALDFFCGAASALEENGDAMAAKNLGMVIALLIAVRGYMAVVELATREG